MHDQLGQISVVVPVHGDGGSLCDLAARLQQVLAPIAPWELILVNDGSPPPAWDRIRLLSSSHSSIKALDLHRNAGQHQATLAGIRASTGTIIVTMDDDLQHPPEAIPLLLRHLGESNDDVVYGTPIRAVHGWRRRAGGGVIRQVVALLSGVSHARRIAAFRAFKGTLRAAFDEGNARVGFIDGVLCRATDKVGVVPVCCAPRSHGRSGYGPRRLLSVTAAMAVGFGLPPGRIVVLIAAGCVSAAAGVALWRHPPGHPVIAGVLTAMTIGLGGLLLAAGIACVLLVARHRTGSPPGGVYAIRTSINLDRP